MDMAKPNFFTYSSEYNNIEQLVLAKPEIETGGDLFGLWVNESTVVLQLITGPGQNCKRTEHSFFQDVEYLSRTGNRLTQRDGLCNMGEWHSHHRLGLPKPSGGDQRTVWENLPKLGLPRFVLLIANITGNAKSSKVNIGAFLFDWGARKMVEGDIVKLGGPSVFRSNPLVMDALESGREEKDEDYGGQQGSTVINGGCGVKTIKAKREVDMKQDVQNTMTTLTKRQRKRNRKKENKSKRQNEQVPDHVLNGHQKQALENTHGAIDSFESIDSQIKHDSKALQQVQCKDVGTQTQQESETIQNDIKKKKRKGGKNNGTLCKKILTHASQILEFTSQLYKDLDDPRFDVHNKSTFRLNFQLESEEGSGISISLSKCATESNAFPKITLNTKEGTVVEQVSSWPLQEAENQKTVKNLKKKLVSLNAPSNVGISLWQHFIVNLCKTAKTRVLQSDCVIL